MRIKNSSVITVVYPTIYGPKGVLAPFSGEIWDRQKNKFLKNGIMRVGRTEPPFSSSYETFVWWNWRCFGGTGDVLLNTLASVIIGFLRGGLSKGRGCSWETLRILFGKIGEP